MPAAKRWGFQELRSKMKYEIAILLTFASTLSLANPGVEYLASGGTFGGLMITALILVIIFIIAHLIDKVKNFFRNNNE